MIGEDDEEEQVPSTVEGEEEPQHLNFVVEFLEIQKEHGMEYMFETGFNNLLVPLKIDEFCANFVNDNGVCTSEVKGKKIKFNQETLWKIWDVPYKGTDVYFKRKGTVTKGVSYSNKIQSK